MEETKANTDPYPLINEWKFGQRQKRISYEVPHQGVLPPFMQYQGQEGTHKPKGTSFNQKLRLLYDTNLESPCELIYIYNNKHNNNNIV